jgi:hypothetical protein
MGLKDKLKNLSEMKELKKKPKIAESSINRK